MTWPPVLLARVRGLFRSHQTEQNLAAELDTHLHQLAAEHERQGASPSVARAAARREFGGVDQVKETYRDRRGLPSLEALFRDVRHAASSLLRSPAFAVPTMLALALSLGAAASVFSVVHALFLRPLPISEPTRVVGVQRLAGTSGIVVAAHSYADYRELQQRNSTFSALTAFSSFSAAIDTGSDVRRELLTVVSGDYFETLGVRPLLGRYLTPDDDRDGAAPAIVLAYDYWVAALEANPDVVGRTLRLTAGRAAGSPPDLAFTVVGVAPRGFYGTDISWRTPAWIPLHALMPEARLADRTKQGISLTLVGRLRSGISADAAQENLGSIATTLAREFPSPGAEHRLLVTDVGWVSRMPALRTFASAMTALTLLLLAVAFFNAALTFTNRVLDRRKELQVRVALGASRARITRLVLAEVIAITGTGTLLGLVLATAATRFLSRSTLPGDPPLQFDVHLEPVVLSAALLAAGAAVVIAALAAAHAVTALDLASGLKETSGSASNVRRLTRELLMVAQVSVSCVLMTACLISVDDLRRAVTMPLGFDAERLATLTMDFDVARYSPQEQRAFMQRAAARVRGLPGVASTTYVTTLPLATLQLQRAASRESADNADTPPAPVVFYAVAGDYLRTMGMRIVDGRDLRDDDPAHAIVNQAFVRQVLGRKPALGARVRIGAPQQSAGDAPLFEIVGVTTDAKYESLWESSRPAIFTPLLETPFGRPTLVVRTTTTPAGTAAEARRAIAALDPRLPIRNVGSAGQLLTPAFVATSVAAALSTAFGAIATALAVLGLHGVVTYAVLRRRREVGIRLALGSSQARIVAAVTGRVAALALAGLAVGLLASGVARRLLTAAGYLTGEHGPALLLLIPLVMCLATAGALVGPVTRCLRIQPATALRSE